VIHLLTLFLITYAHASCDLKFTDQDLVKFLALKKSGLILVVSDGMPYSEKSIIGVKDQAKKRNLPLLVLSDRIGIKQQKRCDQIITSSQLIEKGAFRHFPTLFSVVDHKLSQKVIPGIQTEKQLDLNLNEIFKAASQSTRHH
jgi:hypothetical protein